MVEHSGDSTFYFMLTDESGCYSSEFELHWCYYVYFQPKITWKTMHPLIFLPLVKCFYNCSSTKVTLVLNSQKGLYSIKERNQMKVEAQSTSYNAQYFGHFVHVLETLVRSISFFKKHFSAQYSNFFMTFSFYIIYFFDTKPQNLRSSLFFFFYRGECFLENLLQN